MRRATVALALVVASCTPNPRSEMPAIAQVALDEMKRTGGGTSFCVDPVVTAWQPAAKARRVDTPAPPGFEHLREAAFRGGGALKGGVIGGIRVTGGTGCFDLRGPLVTGDRAMIEVHMPGTGWNVWERRVDGDWRVLMTTTSEYPI